MNRIHTHPQLERKHNIPLGHVIIDEEFFIKAWRDSFNVDYKKSEHEQLENNFK